MILSCNSGRMFFPWYILLWPSRHFKLLHCPLRCSWALSGMAAAVLAVFCFFNSIHGHGWKLSHKGGDERIPTHLAWVSLDRRLHHLLQLVVTICPSKLLVVLVGGLGTTLALDRNGPKTRLGHIVIIELSEGCTLTSGSFG